MSLSFRFLFCVFLFVGWSSPLPVHGHAPDAAPRFRVVVFSKTEGYRHESIPAGIQAVEDLGAANDFEVEATEDAAVFSDERLSTFDAVVFLNTNGDVLAAEQQDALRRFVEGGGGWVGVHSAAATEYDWPWYGQLVGAYFDDHPEPQAAVIQVADRVFPASAHLPDRWEHFDEWYNFRGNPRGSVHVLMTLDESSFEGGTMGHDHPIAWAHAVGAGRAFYTGLGHTSESYAEPQFLMHLLGGIEWAAGAVDGDAAATIPSSFRTIVLEDKITDPMELDVAADGRVFWIERQGPLRVWDPATGRSHLAGTVPSWMVIEDGASGMALDPDFLENGWIYIYYTPSTGEPNRIARFTYRDGLLDLASEKVILEVPVQRDYCCHSAGYLLFDKDGNLWLSTGDNTHNIIDGGAPIDEVPGEEFSDAQRSAANTNDLRGSVLRIRPLPDGSYEIPAGNLFEDDDPRTRPEIYTMGHRNPWRFSIDPVTRWLYVGDVGLGNPPNEKGPWGWEEVNRAKGPAYFGWPYFAGPNEPYNDFDVATGEIGPPFDPNHVINDSPNNTGLRELPPAEPAFIWYTYGQSDDFPALGAGGMSAAAGPVYRRPETAGPHALPAYYEGAFLFYEWMRNWIMEVRMVDEGELLQINPFLPGHTFSRPIDVKVGPDGALYVAEWGEDFWGSNPDARIIKLEYHGEPAADEELEAGGAASASGARSVVGEAQSAGMPASAQSSVSSSSLTFSHPLDGGFVDFDHPIAFRLEGTTEDVVVHALTGHDTHAHVVDTLAAAEGTVVISRSAHQHHPDLHLSDRFIELRAYEKAPKRPDAEPDATVRLRPRLLEAEHTFDRTASRRSLGGHPAGRGYAETVIIALQGRNGDWAAYDPIHLSGIDSLTIRAKPLSPARIEVRQDSLGGPLLAEVVLDSVTTAAVPPADTPQRREFNEIFDEAMAAHTEAYDPKPETYEGWYDVTVPIQDPGRPFRLVLVFRGESRGQILQVDWLRFEGVGLTARP